jgi:hypothetical protein
LAETPPMSGDDPLGSHHFAIGRRVANEITLIEPSALFDTYRSLALRLGYRPCAPAPVSSKRITRNVRTRISQTPPSAMSAT